MNYRKKILMALGFISTATTTIFGANPFVDVPRDSWAYQSVVTLADAGIIQGVNGSYFQGNTYLVWIIIRLGVLALIMLLIKMS